MAGRNRAAKDFDIRDDLVRTVQRHRKELERLDRSKKSSPNARQLAAAALNGSLKLLAKLDGAGEVSVSQILRSAAWKRCAAKILETARQFPGACEALGKAMRELETGGG